MLPLDQINEMDGVIVMHRLGGAVAELEVEVVTDGSAMPDEGQDQRSLVSGGALEGFPDGLLGFVDSRIDQQVARLFGATPYLGVGHHTEKIVGEFGEERQRRLDGLALRADDQDLTVTHRRSP